MSTSVYFDQFENSPEQALIDELIVESINIYGMDMYYIPRIINNKDDIFNEDTISTFENAYLLEFYIKNVDGFNGQGDLLSKFGLEIRDEMILTVAKTTFLNEVARFEHTARPKEGDLIYFPLNKKLWQIKFIEHESIFYQMGSLQTFDITCQLFEYTNERMRTGIAEIDVVEQVNSLDALIYEIKSQDNFIITDELGFPIIQEEVDVDFIDPIADNDIFETEGQTIIDFSESDPWNEGDKY